METVRLTNGKVVVFPTIEDKEYKFYYCSDHNEATLLQMALTDIGNKCTVDKINGDYYVILFKQL